MSRPDKLRATRTGGYRDVEIVFDGKMLTVNNKDGKDYAQIEATGTAEELIDVLREKHGVVAPGADLLLTNVFNVMMADVVEAAVIGKGVIDGVECDHLAFRNVETDWQIWIEAGAKPIPRKYVITSKGIGEAPQYTLRIKEWKTDVPADAFAFKPDPSAKKIALGELGRHRRSAAGHHQGRRQRNDPQHDQFVSSFDRHRPRRRRAVVEWATAHRSASVAGFFRRGRIGRPLTPMSYAGVARRTTRRAVAVGAVATGAAVCGRTGGGRTRLRAGRGRLRTDCHRLPIRCPAEQGTAGNRASQLIARFEWPIQKSDLLSSRPSFCWPWSWRGAMPLVRRP